MTTTHSVIAFVAMLGLGAQVARAEVPSSEPPGPATATSPAPASTTPGAVASNADASTTARPAEAHPRRTGRVSESTTTWDLNLEGGLGHAFDSTGTFAGWGRIRGGLLWVDESDVAAPMFYSLGVFTDFSSFDAHVSYGLQAELLSLRTGWWVQGGAAFDVAPNPVLVGSLGWSVVGIEAQGRWDESSEPFLAVFGKLRIPIGVLAFAAR
jgi:hypothetical protein